MRPNRRCSHVTTKEPTAVLAAQHNYSAIEIWADGVVHAVGVTLGLVGAVVMVSGGLYSVDAVGLSTLLVYAGALVAMLGISAAYNLWPISPTKWLLRRFDHSAIYLMIAGTYTPLLMQVRD